MSAVLCVVALPERRELLRQLAADLGSPAAGAPDWLDPERAFDLPIADGVGAAVETALRDLPIDHLVVRPGPRRKRLLLADMDSTIITVECVDELADHLGIKAEVAAVTRRAMNGEIDFAAALAERVAMLAGLSVSVVEEVIRERVRLTPGAAALVATMRAHGAHTILVSGGFTLFTQAVRRLAGFDKDVANTLEIEGGRLTGRLVSPVRDAASKLATLEAACAAQVIPLDAALAIGDGANDLPMLERAGLGLAYHAHAMVRARICARIDHTDLASALFFQGFRHAEIVDRR